jgi:Holliday junction resolvase RusA-like endonuclease
VDAKPDDVKGLAYELTILGKPRSQKNSKQIISLERMINGRRKRVPCIVDASHVKKWRKSAVKQLAAQWIGRAPLRGNLAIIVKSYLAKRQNPDTDNLLAGPLDALEAAGVVVNDRCFDSAVSLRRVDWQNPRVEILIMPDDWLGIGVIKK